MVETTAKTVRYESYKDSGVAWLGEIPEHWEITRLANIGRFSSSGIDKLIKKNESLVKIINYTDVYKNLELIINSAINFMEVTTPESNRIKNLVKKGDLIFLPSSETLEDLGLSALVDEDIENLSFSYHVLRFEFTAEVAHRFKKYFTNNKKGLNEFSKKGTGSIRKTLGRNDFRNTIVTLPPLQEQTAIAHFLDDKTTKIDEAITIKEQQIQLLKERKQILIHKAVTRGLDENVPLKDSGVEWIGEIPEHWEVKKVTHLFNRIGSGTTPTSGDNRYYDGIFNFLQTGDLNDGKITITKRTLKERAFRDFSSLKTYPKGSLVMAMYGATIGKLGILDIEAATNQACCIFRKSKKIETEYFFQVLLAFRTQIISFGYGGGQPNISQDLIKSLRFPIAPHQGQKEISAYIETASKKIETAINLKQQEIEKLKEYKSSLINGVVTGKVKVC